MQDLGRLLMGWCGDGHTGFQPKVRRTDERTKYSYTCALKLLVVTSVYGIRLFLLYPSPRGWK